MYDICLPVIASLVSAILPSSKVIDNIQVPVEYGHLSLRHALILGQLGKTRSDLSGKNESCEIADKNHFLVKMRGDSSKRLYCIK